MGFWNSISSALSSINSGKSHTKVEDKTHQKYQNDIKELILVFQKIIL